MVGKEQLVKQFIKKMKKTHKKILLVDDDPVSVRVFEKQLINDGYEIIVAVRGQDALDFAKIHRPLIVLLDVMIPDVNGLEIAKQLKKDELTKDIPIVFMTSCIPLEKDSGDQVVELDGQTYKAFAKPLPIRRMLSVIRKEINRSLNN